MAMVNAWPYVGLGTGGMTNATAFAAVKTALKLGYRHIDTAANYNNEEGVGAALRVSGLPRSELEVHVTTWMVKSYDHSCAPSVC